MGASVVLVDVLVDPGGGTGATLNLVDLSNNLLDNVASLWTRGHLRSVGRRLGGSPGLHGRHPELGDLAPTCYTLRRLYGPVGVLGASAALTPNSPTSFD